jgi:prolyl oligopeptidase PreP (S9A serine peptidase family)
VKKRGKWLYNYWQDERNPRGASAHDARGVPQEGARVGDRDRLSGRLSSQENEKWVFKGASRSIPSTRAA